MKITRAEKPKASLEGCMVLFCILPFALTVPVLGFGILVWLSKWLWSML